MNILVTGGTTFVSRRAAEYFAAKGHTVYTLNRGNASQPGGVTHIKCDRHAIGDTLRSIYFDAVLDITAYTSEDVRSLIDALGGFGTYILLSSSAVYPETLDMPFAETDQRGPNTFWGEYGLGKIGAEDALSDLVPDAYIVRPPYLCGAMNNLYREAFVFDCAETGRKMYLPEDGRMRLQFFDCGDLCRFLELIIGRRPAYHIFNVGNTETVTARQWCVMCYDVFGKTPEFEYIETGRADVREYFPFRSYEYYLDVSRQTELMPSLMPLADSLRESYEWYRDNRELVRRKPYAEYIDRFLR